MADTITASSAELPVREEVTGGADRVTAANLDAPATTTGQTATKQAQPQPTADGKLLLRHLMQRVD